MTDIIRTEGIVLKRRDFGETSRVVIVFTRDKGKVQLLAKGARTAKSKFGAALEPLTRAEFVFYWRENKELFTLAEATPLRPLRRLRDLPAVLPFGLATVEAVDKLSAEGDADAQVFDLLGEAIDAVDAGSGGPAVLAQFLVKLAARLGLRADLNRCAKCGKDTARDGVIFVFDEGGAFCGDCRKNTSAGADLEPAVCNYIGLISNLPASQLDRIKAGDRVVNQALAFVRTHLRFHTGLELKSLSYAP